MPEGDTIFRTAATLRRALAGKSITRVDTTLDELAVFLQRQPLIGRSVQAVEPRGKHLLIIFRAMPTPEAAPIRTPEALQFELLRTDLVLHTHLRMTGSWHIYRPGEPWQKPARLARVTLYTEDFVAPCFNAPVVEILTAWQTARHPDLVTLGPDAMTSTFNASEARDRIRRRPNLEISVALMDQRAMAGVGNVFKSEVLFVRRVSPFLKVRDLSDEVLDGLIEESHKLLLLNQQRGERRTVFHLNERDLLWVYGRSGQPCRVCGEPIRMRRQGIDARSTYYCPHCQPLPSPQ